MKRLLVTFVVAALVPLSALPAAAQLSLLSESRVSERSAGWSFMPAMDYAFVWDSNVLLENVGSEIVGEQVHMLKPRGVLAFVGRRDTLTVGYHGAFVHHPNLRSLNSYDQQLVANVERLLSRRHSWFARYAAVSAPSTELTELVGVPFVRIGTRRQDVRTGLQMKLQRNTDATVSYRFQHVDFARDVEPATVLHGGYSHGGNFSVRHALTPRFALTGEYDLQRASVTDGQHFAIHNSWGGVDYAITRDLRAFAAGGVSHLSGIDGRPSRMGPSLRLGITREIERAALSVIYSRSYVPSYGFGGTTDNEELTTRLQVPIGRRLYAASALSLRRNDPLDTVDLSLRSTWFYGSVGYALADWAQLEAYTAATRQNIDRPDGQMNRYQLGFQITAATTTRIR